MLHLSKIKHFHLLSYSLKSSCRCTTSSQTWLKSLKGGFKGGFGSGWGGNDATGGVSWQKLGRIKGRNVMRICDCCDASELRTFC